jgi:hypothetical protein
MAILLPEIRTAAVAAINSITASISVPVADVPNAISPNEEFTFSVTANNTAANTIRATNVRYHVTMSSLALLKVPATPPARTSNDPTAPVLAVGSFVSGYYLFPTDNSLDVDDSDTISNLKGKALALGSFSIGCHIHADPDLNSLFPNGTSTNSTRTIAIV